MTSRHFSFFRIIFGIYLMIHFLMLIPFAGELFGADGVLKNAASNPAPGLFPNPLNLPLSTSLLRAILAALAAMAGLFTLGIARPVFAVLLWLGWSALFHRNQLIANPSLPYVGLLLLLCALVPAGELWSMTRRRNLDWSMPVWVPRTAWILLATGYTFSGIVKLSSPSWVDGSAITYLLGNPLARPGIIRDLMLALPAGFLMVLTWLTLIAEVAFLPLACWWRTRPWIWSILVVLHLGIMAVVDFADLSLGMLMVHAFTFSELWLKKRHGHGFQRPAAV